MTQITQTRFRKMRIAVCGACVSFALRHLRTLRTYSDNKRAVLERGDGLSAKTVRQRRRGTGPTSILDRSLGGLACGPLSARQLAHEVDHLQGRQGALASFIAYVASGAMDRLFERIAGQQAEQDRNARPHREGGQFQAYGAIDVLVVRRLAANHRAQTDDRAVTVCWPPGGPRPAGSRTRRAPKRPRSVLAAGRVAANVSSAPASSCDVTDSLYRDTTIATPADPAFVSPRYV